MFAPLWYNLCTKLKITFGVIGVLFREAVNDVEWAHIEGFCELRRPEDAYLDYKSDFPRELERTIAAMANTLGGWILIGVAEDEDTKPVLPVAGVAYEPKLSERVTNIILDTITPPVFPDVRVCSSPAGDRTVMVLRVPQSHQTPHAIMKNTRVYLRTGNRNTPEELATVEQVEWLREHRRKSEELRVELYERAAERARFFLGGAATANDQRPEIQTWLTIASCPVYPLEPLLGPPELLTLQQHLLVPEYPRQALFPPHNQRSRIVQDGLVMTGVFGERSFLCHAEWNIFGLFYYRESALRYPRGLPNEAVREPAVWTEEVLHRIDLALTAASQYYERVRYWGPVLLSVHLSGIAGETLISYPFDTFAPRGQSPDRDVRYQEIVPPAVLREDRDQVTLRVGQHVTWAFGSTIGSDTLQRFFREYQRPTRR